MKKFLRDLGTPLSRNQAKFIRGGYDDDPGGETAPGYCGDTGTSQNCPNGTTAKKCASTGAAYCLEESTGLCKTYGTAHC